MDEYSITALYSTLQSSINVGNILGIRNVEIFFTLFWCVGNFVSQWYQREQGTPISCIFTRRGVSVYRTSHIDWGVASCFVEWNFTSLFFFGAQYPHSVRGWGVYRLGLLQVDKRRVCAILFFLVSFGTLLRNIQRQGHWIATEHFKSSVIRVGCSSSCSPVLIILW